mmetsp:Transcript_18789/g.39387  ORF Transcript_18789/g.39387 Transcript_18789/m.39387 type:complete len:131 (+) Transcript_18789:1198-1590(+)
MQQSYQILGQLPWIRERQRRSQWITRRRQRKEWKEKLEWESSLRSHELQKTTIKLEKYKKEIHNNFGFCADENAPGWKNKENYILQLTLIQYFAQPTNMACHNYCTIKTIPSGTKSLLGLGLKYCLKRHT